MLISEFDYELPTASIAQVPLEPRDSARLLIDRGPTAKPRHGLIPDLIGELRTGDVVVVNDTRVIAARLKLTKTTGGSAEVFLLEPIGDGSWQALIRPARRLKPGTKLTGGPDDSLQVVIGARLPGGRNRVEIDLAGRDIADVADAVALDGVGETPLPPYIETKLEYAERYQTVFADRPGSVAAPTAGLHLTTDLLAAIAAKGAEVRRVELVVGLDTFRPVSVENLDDHVMHSERYDVSQQTLDACKSAKRVIAVGTTTTRALESAATTGELSGRTEIFIQREYEWKVVDLLMTNFHMPKSTLLVMIDAFVGPRWRDIYGSALANNYRFLSFGDAMLLSRGL